MKRSEKSEVNGVNLGWGLHMHTYIRRQRFYRGKVGGDTCYWVWFYRQEGREEGWIDTRRLEFKLSWMISKCTFLLPVHGRLE